MSYIPYLFPLPFESLSTVQSSEQVKECVELRNSVIQENKNNWILMLLVICGGIVSGILILSRKNYGRVIALTFATALILIDIYHYSGFSFKLIFSSLKAEPILFFRNEILRLVIGLTTIVYLTRSPVISEFKKKNSNHSWRKAVHTS